MPILLLLLLVPVTGGLLILLLPKSVGNTLARSIALTASAVTLLMAWGLLLTFEPGESGLQFFDSHVWNERMGTALALGLDGFSFPMVLLATLLCTVAIAASASIKESPRGYFLLMLLLEAAMLGVFMAQDWALFYVFWEATLIPLFFLIDRWGGKGRQGASLNFVLYTMGGSVFMLVSLLVLFDTLGGTSFSIGDMVAGARNLDATTQTWLFLGLLIGFGVKMPIFPIHGWLPLAHVEAPSPVSILLSGILLKMGSYGLIRAAEMLPLAVIELQGVLAALALISLIYGGLLAWRQSDLKRMIAYSSVSHMGVVLLGIAALNQAGLTGAVLQMFAHGLVAGALFLLIGLLYERTHTRDINDYSSLVQVTPRFAFFTTLAFIGGVGMPGTAGFVAELHALIGGFERWGVWVVLLSIGVLISAAYAIRTVSRLFTGPVAPQMRNVPDLTGQEMAAAGVLSFGILSIGLLPAPLIALADASITRLSAAFALPL